MARIKTYSIDTDISPDDKVVGTDGNQGVDFGKTKNFTIAALASFVGSGTQGPQGAQGPSGITGPAGADGSDGAQGIPGNNGAPGAPGAPGSNGAPGATGPTGPAGSTGAAGAQGAAGADGTSITILGTKPTFADLPATGNTVGDLWVIDQTGGGATAGDGYVWTAGNVWLNIGPLRGPQGIQGIDGLQGAQGSIGATGATGNDGNDGSDGGEGAKGDQGEQGPIGPIGPQGAIGPTGLQGPTGPQGSVGGQGIKGDTGSTGATGPAGGVNSILQGANIVLSSTTGDVTVSAPDVVKNDKDIWTSVPKITQIVTVTQAEYDAGLGSNPNWLTIIVG